MGVITTFTQSTLFPNRYYLYLLFASRCWKNFPKCSENCKQIKDSNNNLPHSDCYITYISHNKRIPPWFDKNSVSLKTIDLVAV